MQPLEVLLAILGAGTMSLGLVHMVTPRLMDIERADPQLVAPPRALPVVGDGDRTRRHVLLGVIWVSRDGASVAVFGAATGVHAWAAVA